MAKDGEPLDVDDLASIYRTECRSRSLSDIRKDFYPAVTALSDSVRRDYEEALKKDPGSLSSEGTSERRKKIHTHFRNIVDKRMEKIVSLALLGAMGGDNSVDHLTPEEKEYYSAVLEVSKKHRSVVDLSKTKMRPTVLNVEPDAQIIESGTPLNVEEPVKKAAEKELREPIIVEEPAKEPLKEELYEPEEQDTMTIRILEDLPVFSGPDRDYDLKREDVIRMPAVMANALIVREKAVKIDVTP